MRKKKTGIRLLVGLFFLIMIADIISTYSIGRDLVQYLEANPLYPHIWLIILLNIALAGGFYWLYNKARTVTIRFALLNSLMTVCVIRIIIVWNNIQVAMDPPTIQQAMQVTEVMKTAAVTKFAVMAILPYLIGYLAFYVFTLDHKIEMKEDDRDDTERYYNVQ